jgi:nucleoporin GLE1
MRFAAPRTPSPKPRKHISSRWRERSKSTYGIHSDSEDDEDSSQSGGFLSTEDDSEDERQEDYSESDEYEYVSSADERESKASSPAARPSRILASPAQIRQIEEAVAAIRLHTRHHDPYEDWERQTRVEAFKAARKERQDIRSQFASTLSQSHLASSSHRASLQSAEQAKVHQHLESMRMRLKADEDRMREAWKVMNQKTWERIEGVIKVEEDKVRQKVEEERRKEEERKRVEEEKRRKEEEQRKAEEEKKRKEQEEKERKEREEREQEEARQREEAESTKRREEQEALEKLQSQVKTITGFESARVDWVYARTSLKQLKEGPLKKLKSNAEMKKVWSKYRRMITPKIGQVTNDAPTVNRITQELTSVVLPNPPHPATLYNGLLSSLSKAILFQAETEVTASPPSAIPLAQITARLLRTLPNFPQVFYARILHRSGGWFIPYPTPATDVDGTPWGDDVQKRKALGLRNGGTESSGEMMTRVAGIMRVYWEVVKVGLGDGQSSGPVDSRFEVGRLWVWFARITGEMNMLKEPIAAELISVALSILGTQGKMIYGRQWVKMLELIYSGVTQGINPGSAQPSTIGGPTAEGKAAKVRVQLEIERIMNA